MGSSGIQPRITLDLPIVRSRTGIVYNVTPRAVGIIINKIVGNRYIEKRVNVRIEHIRHSKCRQEFLDRVKRNTAASAEAKKSGRTLFFKNVRKRDLVDLWPSERVALKRVPALPRTSHTVSTEKNTPQTIVPVRYETTI